MTTIEGDTNRIVALYAIGRSETSLPSVITLETIIEGEINVTPHPIGHSVTRLPLIITFNSVASIRTRNVPFVPHISYLRLPWRITLNQGVMASLVTK